MMACTIDTNSTSKQNWGTFAHKTLAYYINRLQARDKNVIVVWILWFASFCAHLPLPVQVNSPIELIHTNVVQANAYATLAEQYSLEHIAAWCSLKIGSKLLVTSTHTNDRSPKWLNTCFQVLKGIIKY